MNHNPLEAVASLRVRNVRTRFLSDEEEDILLKACGPAIKPVVIAALHTGLRRTEIATLIWQMWTFIAGQCGYAHLSASHKQNVVYLLDRDSQQFSQQSASQEVVFAEGN